MKNNSGLFGLSEVNCINCKERKGWLLPLISLKSGNPLIANLVEEMKPAAAVEGYFARRDKSKVIAQFDILGLSRF